MCGHRHDIAPPTSPAKECLLGPLPLRVVDLVFRSKMRPGIAMAVETKTHREGLCLFGERHAIHFAVTTRAADSLGDVNAVIEIDVTRQIGDPVPDDRLVVGQTLPHRSQQIRVGPNLGMAGHAGIGRRQAGVPRHFNRGVAESAIDPQAGDMMLVAEGNRLLNMPADMARPIDPRPFPPPNNATE